MKKLILTTLALPFLCWATTAQAIQPLAEISKVQGKVLVNQGKGFRAVLGAKSLNAGDQVMVSTASSAVISFSKGCALSITKPSVVRINENTSCTVSTSAFEVGSTVSPAGMVITPTASGRSTNLTLPIAMGAAAAVGTIVFFATQDKNNSVSATAN